MKYSCLNACAWGCIYACILRKGTYIADEIEFKSKKFAIMRILLTLSLRISIRINYTIKQLCVVSPGGIYV